MTCSRYCSSGINICSLSEGNCSSRRGFVSNSGGRFSRVGMSYTNKSTYLFSGISCNLVELGNLSGHCVIRLDQRGLIQMGTSEPEACFDLSFGQQHL